MPPLLLLLLPVLLLMLRTLLPLPLAAHTPLLPPALLRLLLLPGCIPCCCQLLQGALLRQQQGLEWDVEAQWLAAIRG
jgi:hypothetical protein